MGPGPGSIPYVDQHGVEVQAPVLVVWRAVAGCLPHGASARLGAAILGTVPLARAG